MLFYLLIILGTITIVMGVVGKRPLFNPFRLGDLDTPPRIGSVIAGALLILAALWMRGYFDQDRNVEQPRVWRSGSTSTSMGSTARKPAEEKQDDGRSDADFEMIGGASQRDAQLGRSDPGVMGKEFGGDLVKPSASAQVLSAASNGSSEPSETPKERAVRLRDEEIERMAARNKRSIGDPPPKENPYKREKAAPKKTRNPRSELTNQNRDRHTPVEHKAIHENVSLCGDDVAGVTIVVRDTLAPQQVSETIRLYIGGREAATYELNRDQPTRSYSITVPYAESVSYVLSGSVVYEGEDGGRKSLNGDGELQLVAGAAYDIMIDRLPGEYSLVYLSRAP